MRRGPPLPKGVELAPCQDNPKLRAFLSGPDITVSGGRNVRHRSAKRERADAIALDAYHGRVKNFKTAKELGWNVSAAEYFAPAKP